MKADETAPAETASYLATRVDLKPATLNRYRSTMSMIFAEGIRNGRITINLARLVRLRKEDNARIRFFTYKEEAPPDHFAALSRPPMTAMASSLR